MFNTILYIAIGVGWSALILYTIWDIIQDYRNAGGIF